MMQASVDAIIALSLRLIGLAKDPELLALEKEMPAYSQQIEQFFNALDKEKLTSTDAECLESIMENHKKIAALITNKKDIISNNIKQLQTGKEMQNTYPKAAF